MNDTPEESAGPAHALMPTVLPTPQEVGRHVAGLLASSIEATNRNNMRFVLGCPSGRSPIPVLDHLAREVAERDLDLSQLHIVMMDEYLTPAPSGQLVAVDPSLPHSCRGFAHRTVLGSLNVAARPGRCLRPEHVWIPDPGDPDAFEQLLTSFGGIDFFLLATGAGDGHVAFNPQGSPRGSRTRIVELSETTRRDNLSTFPTLERIECVPRHGVTVGIETILAHSKRAVMVAHGTDKADAVARITSATAYDPSWPSTVLVECNRPCLVADDAAAALLSLADSKSRPRPTRRN